MATKVPFALSASEGRHVKATKENLVNMMADQIPNPSAKSSIVLLSTPGWDLSFTVPTPQIVGTHYFKDKLYVVTTTKVYRIDDGNLVVEIGSVTLPSGKPASIADNGIEMVIVSGVGYKTDGVTVTQITDAGYYPSDTVTFQDGYFIFNRSGTGQFFISGLYATTFDPTMYATAEGSPDNLLGLVSDHRQLWLFGSQSIEVWYNSGDALFPFDRIQGSFSHRGCMDYRTISAINNTVYWVGDDGIVYFANGYMPQPISTPAIEYAIATRTVSDLVAYTYTEEGHFFYVLTIGDDVTYVFDTRTSLWHIRESLGSRWGLAGINRSASGTLVGYDYITGNIYNVGIDYHTENGQLIKREAVTSPFHNGVDYFTLNKFEIDMETGKSPINSEDTITLAFSMDGGVEFKNNHTVSLGKEGERRTRVIWRRLGRHRNLTLKVTTRCHSQINILAAYAEMR